MVVPSGCLPVRSRSGLINDTPPVLCHHDMTSIMAEGLEKRNRCGRLHLNDYYSVDVKTPVGLICRDVFAVMKKSQI